VVICGEGAFFHHRSCLSELPGTDTLMLLGEYNVPLGDKNRVALPKALRDELGDQLLIARGYEKSLMIMDKGRWQRLMDNINAQPLLNIDVRDTKRYLIAGTFTISLDKQGRFVVPEALVDFAAIGTQVTFLGVGEWVELWDTNNWQTRLTDLTIHASEIADRLI
jgi:MraZ protein